ncbi:DUF4825 domain-containing protein [Heyndrickxia sp. NPDC080065]|uniref:DUF4825 domain-containing protein n=1 Tax=Heyndrickxia sp. NPDC080065 TaxID=3390568 RepID=UPI003D05B705
MKTRNRIIIGLVVIGIILYGVVNYWIVPQQNVRADKYLEEQKEPTTHDIKSILKFKNKYMGNAGNLINLFNHLPLSNVGTTFQLYSDDLALEVNYKETVWNIGEVKVNQSLIYNSTAAFALIDNLQAIIYNFPGTSYKVKRTDVEKLYSNFGEILKEDHWNKEVQNKLNDSEFVTSAEKVLVKQ